MKAATLSELKKELCNRTPSELLDLCLCLSKYKKENKELLTYLLYEASNEPAFVESVKKEIREQFEEINRTNYHYIKKSVRKILRNIKKYIRYSKKKETEVELLLCFCSELKRMKPSMENNIILRNSYQRQVDTIKRTVSTLHEDLQYDYKRELKEIL